MVKKRGVDIPGFRTSEGPAQLWRRIFAFLVDLCVINFFFLSPFSGFFESVVPSSFSDSFSFLESNVELTHSLVVVLVFVSLLSLLYFSVLEYKVGQTLGKYFFGIYVKSEGKSLSFWQCVLSNITFIPFFPFFILWIVDPLHLFFSVNGQRLMEKLSKVVIVQKFVV